MADGSVQVFSTATFARWLRRLKDESVRVAILARIARLEDGLWGDVRSIGDAVIEFRVMQGPGYRLYGMRHGCKVVLLLCGGDKGSQRFDIARAKRLARRIRQEGAFDEESV